MASTICGWCGDRTHMIMVTDPYELPSAVWPRDRAGSPDRDRPVYMAAFKCSNENCERLSIGWASLYKPAAVHPKQQLPKEHLQWDPVRARRLDFPDVPEEIAATASEAHACLSIGAARGAVALARAVVEATAKAKGFTSGGIQGKINALRDQGVISPLTADTSQQIRDDGNSIAHGDIGDEPISGGDAEAILEFMDELLGEVFQRPAKLQRLKERHEERKQGNRTAAAS
ncbi:DUF4145 domain-containing protein [Streptomyces beihaiensis]|uniref:DUF4145 domain-containing protein n=1 Tax=Streptomyces beihaiensis TaxID=2984495 RepID=A0ABT3TR93_9ACTN|nr:DUF4145 domain-containing protein [Streptomyces beihaiensis]MCX3059564.1 DUF4145 domain-containing protein [Streptomyces beihaiensis]